MPGCYVVFHKQLGDMLLLEPALSRLRAHHGAPVSVLTRNGHGPLLQLMEGVEWQRGLPLAWRSHLYCFDPLNKSAWRALLTPAGKKTVILPDRTEMAWFHRPLFGDVIVPELRDRYVAEYFWSLVPVPAKEPFRPPRLTRPPDSWRPAGFSDEPFILLNPTSGWRRKNWKSDRWAEVLRALHQAGAPPFVMTSASTDWQVEHCREIEQAAGPIVRSLASGTTLENFLWLCAHARLVLSVDGAASHLASAFGVKNLTLFGPTNIRNWHQPAPTSVALQASKDKDGKARVRNLTASEVADAALTLWRTP